MRVLRIFPRRTQATPDDAMARVGFPDLFPPECDEVHVSVTFTKDLRLAGLVADSWERRGIPVMIGGPALKDPGGEFIVGRYLKEGYVITSRGCPNRCWFCAVPEREGGIRELPIRDGWKLLACSKDHVKGVFAMLERQPRRAEFTGGLEAARMETWIAEDLLRLKPQSIYFAYDRPSEKDALASAVSIMRRVGHRESHHSLSAYVLVGYPGDAFPAASERLEFVLSLGVLPFAMLYCDGEGRRADGDWRRFQREWCRPTIVAKKMSKYRGGKNP
jgi:hypothetical protein